MHTQLSPAPVKGPPDQDKSTTSTPPHDRFIFPTIDQLFAVLRPQSHLHSFLAGTSAVPRHSAAITVVNTALPWCSWGVDVKRDAHGVPERFVRPRPHSTFSISFVMPLSSPPSPTGVEHCSLKCSLLQALALSTFPPSEIDSLLHLPAQPVPNSPSYNFTLIIQSFSIFNTHSQALRIPNGKLVGREKQNQGGKKTKRNDLQGICSLTEGDTMFFTFSTEHSSPMETTPLIQPSVSAHLDPG
ncbi:hypothetical protein Hypma_013146 [Hypsizygus marmoreus]|uniref:Uncharacterized protein n=1 Tax=Hypsizygus marmoreus TaxID=39966 RepID=A0A369JIE8_HYPMA|nr:hypothetical protein Hypma_013146 [Hypsizygus marmoreus]